MRESSQPPQLSRTQAASLIKAQEACAHGNHDYAIILLAGLLREVPNLIDARRLLRSCELARAQSKPSPVNAVKIAHYILRGKTALRSNPLETIEIAEEILTLDPTNLAGNELLAEAATLAGLSETEILAYEVICDSRPKDTDYLKRLAKAYMHVADWQKAQRTYEDILAITPHDAEALQGIRDATAMHATAVGRWEQTVQQKREDTSTTNYLPSPEDIESTSPETIQKQIYRLYAELDPQSPDRNVAQQIAELYELKREYKSAMDWYEYAFALSSHLDPSIEKAILGLKIQQIDDKIHASSNNAVLVDDLMRERTNLLLASARQRVKRYPNDLALRYELGEALVLADRHREAIPELQRALRHPYVRYRAYNLLGYCYWNRNMFDLAIKQYEVALPEMTVMDDLKKEMTYNYASILEQTEQYEAAMEELKKIYEVDSQYRDVSQRLEYHYQGMTSEEA